MTDDLPTGQSVAAIGALFFATAGVATWASTCPAGLAFPMGIGWCLVLIVALWWLWGRTGLDDAERLPKPGSDDE